jgi:diadenosine tetraphosphate (Ap4A) HIT family hydrolase
MATLAPWFELRLGQGCPLCAPRPPINEFSYYVCTLTVSSLYIVRDQTYRGTCAVVYDPAHVSRPSELDEKSWRQFSADVWSAESAISRSLRPDHVNVVCLGNTVPHLHAGIIPRYRSDPSWGRPIWTDTRDSSERSAPAGDDDCEELAHLLRQNMSNAS